MSSKTEAAGVLQGLGEYFLRAPIDLPEERLVSGFETDEIIATILSRPQHHIVVAQGLCGLIEETGGHGGTVRPDCDHALKSPAQDRCHRMVNSLAEIGRWDLLEPLPVPGKQRGQFWFLVFRGECRKAGAAIESADIGEGSTNEVDIQPGRQLIADGGGQSCFDSSRLGELDEGQQGEIGSHEKRNERVAVAVA